MNTQLLFDGVTEFTSGRAALWATAAAILADPTQFGHVQHTLDDLQMGDICKSLARFQVARCGLEDAEGYDERVVFFWHQRWLLVEHRWNLLEEPEIDALVFEA